MIDLKVRREELNLTLEEVGDFVGVTKSTVRKWENGMINNMGRDKIAKYAEILKISPLELLEDTKPYYALTDKEKLDIGEEVDKLLKGLFSTAEVNFYGEPMTDEDKEKLRIAMQMAMELNKEKAKKHFTPKKYRNE
ncbi:helix-turn-helix domain-containing protein [Aerococcaceae bacterium NML190938]|nr:helix-turn-helix domain-containing protein [Aerococcaceae bacterium NML190938]